ncbi:MAG: MGMT family protein [Actinomycetota bacterium]|nr:MGMT family protein [Actinomycetota bacterium]
MSDRTPSSISPSSLTAFEEAVVAVLRSTEPGDVLSYGEVAAEAGFPGAARAVGGVLRRVDSLPWWRVVAANGRLIPHDPAEHAHRLRAEGVEVRGNRVVLGPGPQSE